MTVTQVEFEKFLRCISDCFIARDLKSWRDRLVLPFSIITKDGLVRLDTEGEVRENFEYYLQACSIMSLDFIDRSIISIEDCCDGTYLGTYETRLISFGQLATEPYVSTALLLHEAGELKMKSIMNGRGHHEWTRVLPNDQILE